MKGRYLLPLYLFTITASFAITPPPGGASSNVAHVVSGMASQQIASANATTTPTAAPTLTYGAGSGYFELVGGYGLNQVKVTTSRLGISKTESDWVAQTNNDMQSPFGQFGLGYVYSLNDSQRAYSKKLVWFPCVETLLLFNYFNVDATGNVSRFGNPSSTNPYTATFTLPVKTTSLMLDFSLSLLRFKRFSIFILGGAGEAWSRISYHDTPNNNPLARPPLHLNSRTQSNMVYEWGTGMNFEINKRFALSVEYLYTHIGNIKTSGLGTLGGAVDKQISAAGFSLRRQTVLMDLHVALN